MPIQRKRTAGAGVVAALILTGLIVACGNDPTHTDADQAHGGSDHDHAHEEGEEGRTQIAEAVAAAAGIETGLAGPGLIHERINLSGTISMQPSASAEVRAVYPGRVLRVHGTVGDAVKKGEALAEVESSSSLQAYTVRAPISGTILERRTNEGDVTGSDPLFRIGDLGALQAELHVFPRDSGAIAAGQTATVRLAGVLGETEVTIDSFLPLATSGSQSLVARARLPRDAGFRPGMRIAADVNLAAEEVLVAVQETALQRYDGADAVFVRNGDEYEARKVEIGRRDGTLAEILSGLRAGETYVTANSFLIKADIEKAGASHDH